ncbi:MAG TPA: ligase-associated DNA damage response endonuclease PdeM [Flavobacteriales bacterium]
MTGTPIEVEGEHLLLFADKAMYWPERRTLVLADLHLGKAMHFRRAGIAAPPRIESANLDRLDALLQALKPEELLLLGDLFHSRHNASWEAFVAFRSTFPHTRFTLITGNHDILHPEYYERAGLRSLPWRDDGPFHFTHHPTRHERLYNIAGHIHPGVRLLGKGRQHLTLPCFFFGGSAAVLPAFGTFTGVSVMHPEPTDRVFAIAQRSVFRCAVPGT